MALFSAHEFTGSALLVFVTLSYLLWGITYTVMDIPFWSMVPALSFSREERERLVVWPRLFASFAWMIMGACGLAEVDYLGGGSEGYGFFQLSGLVALSFLASAAITFFKVKEQVSTAITSVRFKLRDVMELLRSNDQLASLIG